MPVRVGKDSRGCFCRWGNQEKYYFQCSDEDAKKRAMNKAAKQGRAIAVSRAREAGRSTPAAEK